MQAVTIELIKVTIHTGYAKLHYSDGLSLIVTEADAEQAAIEHDLPIDIA